MPFRFILANWMCLAVAQDVLPLRNVLRKIKTCPFDNINSTQLIVGLA